MSLKRCLLLVTAACLVLASVARAQAPAPAPTAVVEEEVVLEDVSVGAFRVPGDSASRCARADSFINLNADGGASFVSFAAPPPPLPPARPSVRLPRESL